MRDEIEQEIRAFVVDEILQDPEAVDAEEDPALLSGLLDSFGLMTLLQFVEDRYDIVVANDQITRKNFESVRVLAGFLEERIRESGLESSGGPASAAG